MKIQQTITDFSPFNTIKNKSLKTKINKRFHKITIQPCTLVQEKSTEITRIGYICSGRIDLLRNTENQSIMSYGSISRGDYFGIEVLFDKGLALFDELAVGYVECFTIEKEKFIRIIEEQHELKIFFKNLLFEKLEQYLYSPGLEIISRQNPGIVNQGERLNKLISFIGSNYSDNITLDDIAKEIGLSRFHASRMFKYSTGHTFKEYLNLKRIEVAKKLMKTPEINVSQACFSVGFNDVSYFSRIFKKYEGINPSNFQKKFRVA